jgi:hypothetical protein
MSGCGKLLPPEEQKLTGDTLRCGVNLYWKVPEAKWLGRSEKTRRKETLLCSECKAKGESNE